MKRAIFIWGFALTGSLLALAYWLGSDQPTTTVEPTRGEFFAEAAEDKVPQASIVDTTLNASTELMPLPSDADHAPLVRKNDNWDASGGADEETTRKRVKENSTRRISNWYSLLLEDLDLTPSEQEALLSFLVEDLIARTTTDYVRGKPMDEHVRSNRIAIIIGEAKLQQFLALERDLSLYAEAQKIGSMLQQYGVPLSDAQRDRLLKILIEVGHQHQATPPAELKLGSIEELEYVLSQRDEFERHVMELAPSALSSEQVTYLFEQYQYLSYARADALEQQKERAAATGEDGPSWYPKWRAN